MQAPSNQNRIAVIGRTGSGKTQFSMWLLGKLKQSAWANMPITIFDFKRAKLIGQLLKTGEAKRISIDRKPPTDPGLYVVQPAPVDDDIAVLDYLKRIYENTGHCLYFDEAYELGPRNRGFRRLLTQGRELNIPMLYCTQRPVNCDRYSLSEADYMAIFKLRIADDRLTIQNMVPDYNPLELGNYECYWYDVASDQGDILAPVPSAKRIIGLYTGETFETGENINHDVPDQPEERRRVML